MSPVRDNAREHGFTLLEVLVGLVISSLIMVSITYSVRGINAGYVQATGMVDRQRMLTTALEILSGDVSRIQRVYDTPDRPSRFLFFGGKGEAIYILAERPGSTGGLYWVRLLVRNENGVNELVRMRAPYRAGQVDFTIANWRDEVVLLRGKMGIELSYRAPLAGLRSWAATWEARDMLPGQVMVSITDGATGRLRIPVFVETLKIAAEAACADPAAAGCTALSAGRIAAASGAP